jgi:uncharacterized lipoprotein YddW (UPF0748 family)
MKLKSLIPAAAALLLMGQPAAMQAESPKREFRGAWLQTVFQGQYATMGREQMQRYFDTTLDKLQAAGINAVIFQVRPAADAFYPSDLEPWSRFLTGRQGAAPSPQWDPMAYLIEACHKRGMEFHAWLNPYRATASKGERLSAGHIYNEHPEWFVEYDGKLYFDPGLPQCRKFFRSVVADIIARYDVDAIHMDDYFYPYPVAGQAFPDDASFASYRAKMGFGANERGDWRRQNVNILIKSIHDDIRASSKPWVRFGISPFGIYRNRKSDPDGSLTNGLQNYDDLYADVLRWTREGWVDYIAPQLYWEQGHKAADYTTLLAWWDKHANDVPLYIGQSISRSLDGDRSLTRSNSHMTSKLEMTREAEHVDGNIFWYGYQIADNESGVADVLKRKFHKLPALIPAYTHIDAKPPKEVKRLKARWTPEGYELQWKARSTRDELQRQVYFAVYRFAKGEKHDLNRADRLVGTTRETRFLLPYDDGSTRWEYVVTAVDRCHNESKKGKSKGVKL